MSILRETGESLLKFGEMFVRKTEELAKIGKLNFDIKRIQIEIGTTEKELGRFVLSKLEGGVSSLDLTDRQVQEFSGTIETFKKQMQDKRGQIEAIKAEAQSRKTENGAK